MDGNNPIAYFTMEIGLSEAMPTYAGGLGILAGDTVRSAADMGIPMLGVTLLHRKGHFRQRLDASGWQSEEDAVWPVAELLQEMAPRCTIEIEDRPVQVRAWKHEVQGVSGHSVPVYFLDTDLEQNAASDRALTDHLYGGDLRYRLSQEAVLGIGGVRMLHALGFEDIKRYHMNEGHAALLTLELAYELFRQAWEVAYEQTAHAITPEMVHLVKPRCIFTTHTPVPAGHDQFPLELVHQVISGYKGVFAEREQEFCPDAVLNMTHLALDNSHYINGVAKSHGQVAQQMFSRHAIHSITNGVHAATWAAPPIAALFDRHIPGWREDNSTLRYALNISRQEIRAAHREAKEALIERVNRASGMGFDPAVFTIGFARRAAVYKRADLLFQDSARLVEIARTIGPFQLVYAGKAHPQDTPGKEVIRRIYEIRETLSIWRN